MALAAYATPSRPSRCPACGHRMDAAAGGRCTLCGFAYGQEPVTGIDATPYAAAYASGEPGWRRMAEWVWFAGPGRMKHLALMRSSAASRHFAFINLLMLSAGMALCQTARIGWQWTTAVEVTDQAEVPRPSGKGWLQVAAESTSPVRERPAHRAAALWWNPPQAIIAFVTSWITGLGACALAMLLSRKGLTAAHARFFRQEQRMTAALHYSTAWGMVAASGAVPIGLLPVCYVGAIERWSWFPRPLSFMLAAATLGGVGLVAWWFWLVRLGASAPARTRSRVIAYLAVGAPLFAVAVGAGWWYGLDSLYPALFKRLDLSF